MKALISSWPQLSAPPLCIALLDVEGNSDVILELRQLTVSDFVSRVADFIDVIVQVRFLFCSSYLVSHVCICIYEGGIACSD